MKKPNIAFLNVQKIPKNLPDIPMKEDDSVLLKKEEEFKKKNKDDYYIGLMGNEEIVFCSKLEIRGLELWIPEPNPVLIYFSEAYRILEPILKTQNELESIAKQLNGSTTIETYPYLLKFFSQSSRIHVFLFSTVEAFINQSIPEEFEYTTSKGKIKNKEYIQRYMKFNEKSTELMKAIFSKSFDNEYPEEMETLMELKLSRDGLIHLKTKSDKYRNSYREIMVSLLNINYKELVLCVESFINFYSPNYITYFNNNLREKST